MEEKRYIETCFNAKTQNFARLRIGTCVNCLVTLQAKVFKGWNKEKLTVRVLMEITISHGKKVRGKSFNKFTFFQDFILRIYY